MLSELAPILLSRLETLSDTANTNCDGPCLDSRVENFARALGCMGIVQPFKSPYRGVSLGNIWNHLLTGRGGHEIWTGPDARNHMRILNHEVEDVLLEAEEDLDEELEKRLENWMSGWNST